MTDGPPLDRGPERTPASLLATPYRTHSCGALRASDAGITARLSGWVHRRRDHGQLIFLDLRDRHGITQVVIDRTDDPDAHAVASRVRSEFVITVDGDVAQRLAGHREPAPADRRDRAPGDRASGSSTNRRRRRSTSTSRTPDRRGAPAQVPLPRPAARGDGPPDAPPEPPRPRDPRRPPRARLRRGRDAEPDQVAPPRAPATSSSRAGSSRATSTRCRRARSSSSSC